MKKRTIVILVLAAVAVLAVGITGAVSAKALLQSTNPPAPFQQGFGMMGRTGHGPGMMFNQTGGQYGPMHEYMVQAVADELGLSVEEVQAELDAGKTPYDLFIAKGLSEEDTAAALTRVHTAALDAAVAAGAISQEQADWMKSHMQGNMMGGFAGGCHSQAQGQRGGMMRGLRWNSGS